jgi:hypothetical protein
MAGIPTNTALTALETAAAAARSGFACLFSTSDEYETALIVQRRAQGRYGKPRTNWPMILFFACSLAMAGMVVLFG